MTIQYRNKIYKTSFNLNNFSLETYYNGEIDPVVVPIFNDEFKSYKDAIKWLDKYFKDHYIYHDWYWEAKYFPDFDELEDLYKCIDLLHLQKIEIKELSIF